jgi:GNAT superfamily N-acetyltransferase
MNEPTLETLKNNISIAQASSIELDIVLDILEEAARWITSKGIDQWRPGLFTYERNQRIAEQVAKGEVYLANVDGKPVGTITLQWADPLVWKNVQDDAGYVHRLAIRRTFAGKGLGQTMLNWAQSLAASRGKRYLRLDCMTENAALRSYYARAGFTYCGDVSGKGWSASLYEKSIWNER